MHRSLGAIPSRSRLGRRGPMCRSRERTFCVEGAIQGTRARARVRCMPLVRTCPERGGEGAVAGQWQGALAPLGSISGSLQVGLLTDLLLTPLLLTVRSLLADWPVFYMGGSLALGKPVCCLLYHCLAITPSATTCITPPLARPQIGLHLFEPRYRLLIKVAMQSDRRFVFSSNAPRPDDTAYLCECHRVSMYQARFSCAWAWRHFIRAHMSWLAWGGI